MSLPFFDSAAGRLDEVVKAGVLCAFDFDGTLAPIVRDPDQVAVPAAVARRLAILAEHTPVAIVTGRAVADVQSRLKFAPRYIVGNHGLEGVPGCPPAEQYQALCAQWEVGLSAALAEQKLTAAGVRIENKGCSLSVHYRLARNRDQLESELAKLLAGLTPAPQVIGGKCVFNLLPPAGVDKGAAMLRLMEDGKASSAIYVGDDTTDEDVFRLRSRDLLTVRVGPGGNTSAEFFLHHRLAVVQLLDQLISRLRGHA